MSGPKTENLKLLKPVSRESTPRGVDLSHHKILQDHAGSLTTVPLRNASLDLDTQNHIDQLTEPGQ